MNNVIGIWQAGMGTPHGGCLATSPSHLLMAWQHGEGGTD